MKVLPLAPIPLLKKLSQLPTISLQMKLLQLSPVIPQSKLSQLPLFSLPTQLPLQTWHQVHRLGLLLYQLSTQLAGPLRLQLFMLLLCLRTALVHS